MGVSLPPRRLQHAQVPSVDGLERRQLLSGATQNLANRVSQVWHKYHEYVSELQRVELKSQATPAESLALSDAARAISAAASATPGSAPQAKALAVTVELDRAPLYGWVGKQGWDEIEGRLTANLDGLNVPSTVIDQAITSMEAVARSAGVTSAEYQTLSAKEDSYQDARSSLRNTTAHFPDPAVYYTQHLRGFFRGGAVQQRQGKSTLEADIRSIQAAADDTPAEAGVLRRDVSLLQQVGANLTSQANDQFGNAFVAGFDQVRGVQEQSNLKTEFSTILGTNATPATLGAADRLIADAGAFYQAVGSSQENVRTITTDVQTYVNSGGGAALNPFRVQVIRAPLVSHAPRALA